MDLTKISSVKAQAKDPKYAPLKQTPVGEVSSYVYANSNHVQRLWSFVFSLKTLRLVFRFLLEHQREFFIIKKRTGDPFSELEQLYSVYYSLIWQSAASACQIESLCGWLDPSSVKTQVGSDCDLKSKFLHTEAGGIKLRSRCALSLSGSVH